MNENCNILELQITGNEPLNLQIDRGTGSGNDYNHLINKPQIEGITLQGNKTFSELGLSSITPQEIDEIMFGGD